MPILMPAGGTDTFLKSLKIIHKSELAEKLIIFDE